MFGIESSKGDLDGSKVGEVYYQDQDLDRIAKYCAQDVWVTSNVYLRMNHLPAKNGMKCILQILSS